MKRIIVVAAIAVSCAAVKPVLRTVSDAAAILCETAFGVDDAAERAGISVREYCAIHKNVKPFLDEAMKAQRAGAQRAGLPSPTAPAPDAGAP